MPSRLVGVLGIFVILALAYLGSNNRRAIKWKGVILGLTLQICFAVAILGVPAFGIRGIFRFVFDALNSIMVGLVGFTLKGSQFVFGSLAELRDPWGFVFAFRALPAIIFFSSLMAFLFHIGVLQKVVKSVAWVMRKTMGTSGAETLSVAANIFMGQTEAPLLVRPYIPEMTQSEIYSIMVGGMATIAAGVEAAYIGMLKDRIPDIAGHLLTASCMSACASLVISKMLFPETCHSKTAGAVEISVKKTESNGLEAISRGATQGIELALNVAGMLIAFVALLAMADACVEKIGVWLGFSQQLSFSMLMGYVGRPFAWLIGIPWSEAGEVGKLLGQKVMINEFIAYVGLSKEGTLLSDRSVIITSYALCGFANFASIGIQIGGIGGMAPNQRSTIAKLGVLAVLGGSLACYLSACVAGLLY